MFKICMANWNTRPRQYASANSFQFLPEFESWNKLMNQSKTFFYKLKKSSNHTIATSLETHYILYYIFTVHKLYGADVIIMQQLVI